MPRSIHHSLQKSLFTLLSSDLVLSAMVSGVYYAPPEGAILPYVALQPMVSRDWSTSTTLGFNTTMELRVYSRDGTEALMEIMDRLYELITEGEVSLLNHDLVALRYEGHEMKRDEDGITQEAHLQFRAYSEFIPV